MTSFQTDFEPLTLVVATQSSVLPLRPLPVCGVQQYKWSLLRDTESLKTEIVTAAIAGFEEQKKRLNAQIAELLQMLSPGTTDNTTPAPARWRIAAAQRKRWAARKQAGAASSTKPARKRRRLSGAGRKGIIEATKRR
jgi:hypothetical protein